MKGYMRVIEIILCVLLILSAMTQFSSLYSKNTQWSKNYLSLLSRDIVYTASFLGDDWQNASFVQSSLEKILFSDFIEYEFGLRNSAKINVIAGCFCSSQELSQLRQQLSDFTMNNHGVTFNVLDIADAEDWDSLDVIIIYGYEPLEAQKQNILEFLANDKGIMLIGPITAEQIDSDSVLRDVFGLKWSTNTVSGSPSDASFTATHPLNESYEIMKYFYGFRAAGTSAILSSDDGLGEKSCTNSTSEGIFKTRGSDRQFWIIDAFSKTFSGTYCDYSLFVDENANGLIDDDEGPYGSNDEVIINGFPMKVRSINADAYNEKAEAEISDGWGYASAAGLCGGDGDDVCSEGDAAYTTTRNAQTTIPITVDRPDRYEVWFRSYRGTVPEEEEHTYFVSIDGGGETLVDPFYQAPEFEGMWGWNRTGMAGGYTVLLDAGAHTITLRTPTIPQMPQWENSGVDWVFLRNTTFDPKNSAELLFERPYGFADFAQVGPYPDNDRVGRVAIADNREYTEGGSETGPVAAMIIKKGVTVERSRGRAAWIASNADGKDFEGVLKSSAVWLAPKDFINVRNPSLGSSSAQAYTIMETGDMNNLYQIFVTLWYSRRAD